MYFLQANPYLTVSGSQWVVGDVILVDVLQGYYKLLVDLSLKHDKFGVFA